MQIIGHRGGSGHAPENTEAAILAGIRLGATAIELDVQFTADGVPVVFHDRTLERMAGVKARIRGSTLRELSGYDIGFRAGAEHRGLRILALDDAAALVPRGLEIHVVVLDYDPIGPGHIKDLLAILKRRGGLDRCWISSFSEKVLSALKDQDGGVRLALLVEGGAKSAAKRAADLGCAALGPEAGHVDSALIEACHNRRMKVFPHTVNDPPLLKTLVGLGVDGIYTSFPGRMAEIVRGAAPSRRAAQRREEAISEPLGKADEILPLPAAEELEEPAPLPAGGIAVVAEEEIPRGSEAQRKKRRRGKRGGRRVRERELRKRAAAEEAAPGSLAIEETGGAEVEAPAAESEDESAAESPPLPPDDPAGEGEEAPAATQAQKKRRRGKRGGRRVRERLLRKGKVAGGRGSGAAATASENSAEGGEVVETDLASDAL